MRVVYTDNALAAAFPSAYDGCERRLRAVERRIGVWPESGQNVNQRPGVRAVPLVRYPIKVFYRVTATSVEILHIRHAARRDW